MKKLTSVVLTIVSLMPLLALAQIVGPGGTGPGGVPQVPTTGNVSIPNILNSIINWATGLLILLAVIFVVYAAFLYLTSGGDDEKVKTAKKFIVFAAVAVVVALLARGVVYIVQQLIPTSTVIVQ